MLQNRIRDIIIKHQILYDIIYFIRQRILLLNWMLGRADRQPPHIVKQDIVKNYGKLFKLKTLVETGTYLGDMVASMKNHFANVYSIELDYALYTHAKRRFYNSKNVFLFQGDSGKLLPQIIEHVNDPCLFWLDAHYSGGITAKSYLETPIICELEAILDIVDFDYVILIDDARNFTDDNDYPSLEYLIKFVNSKNPELIIEVKNDIIRIYNPRASV
jgi:hypothetical protein